MTDIATMTRIDEILDGYKAEHARLASMDFTEEIEREVAAFREKLTAVKTAQVASELRDVEISIKAVENVKAKLLEEGVEDATTKQSDFAV